MRAAAALVACFLPAFGAAQEPVRVQNRLFEKDGRVFVNAGATVLDRADYFSNPGVLASISWYTNESNAFEARLAWFFSSLSPSGREVVEASGLVPEAHRPVAMALIGWRHSIGYGKMLIAGGVVHFDLQLAGHGGVLYTERFLSPDQRAFTPALAAAPGAVVRVGERFHAQLDLGAIASLEQRRGTSVAIGFAPSLTAGLSL